MLKLSVFHTYSSEKLNIFELLHCLFWLLFLQIFCLTTQRLKGNYLFQDISWLFWKLTCLYYYFFLIQDFYEFLCFHLLLSRSDRWLFYLILDALIDDLYLSKVSLMKRWDESSFFEFTPTCKSLGWVS